MPCCRVEEERNAERERERERERKRMFNCVRNPMPFFVTHGKVKPAVSWNPGVRKKRKELQDMDVRFNGMSEDREKQTAFS